MNLLLPHHSIKTIRSAWAVALFAANLTAWADSLTTRYSGEMSHIPVGSDVIALGENGVALPRHAASSLWNPAAPAFLTGYEISGEFADLYEGMSKQGCLAMAVPLSDGMATTVVYAPLASGPISRQDTLTGTYLERLQNQAMQPDGSSKGEFFNYQHLVVVSVGKLFPFSAHSSNKGSGHVLPFDLGAGLSFKSYWISMNPDGYPRMGMNVNLDAGLAVRARLNHHEEPNEATRHLLLGMAVRDFLPSPVLWVYSRDEYSPGSEYHEDVVPSYFGGLSYIDESGQLGGAWTLTAAVQYNNRVTYHVGAEAEFWKVVAFRGGLSDNTPVVGAGIRFKKYFLDYSFKFDELAYSFVRVTLGLRY